MKREALPRLECLHHLLDRDRCSHCALLSFDLTEAPIGRYNPRYLYLGIIRYSCGSISINYASYALLDADTNIPTHMHSRLNALTHPKTYEVYEEMFKELFDYIEKCYLEEIG